MEMHFDKVKSVFDTNIEFSLHLVQKHFVFCFKKDLNYDGIVLEYRSTFDFYEKFWLATDLPIDWVP